jgi:biuret amidohydrolase
MPAPIHLSHTALLVIDMQRDFLDPSGYAALAGVDIARLRATIPQVQKLVNMARRCSLLVIFTREGHRPNLSDCPPAKLARSRAAGAEIGSLGPLGRLLVRGERGHDMVDEMQVMPHDIIIDKPGYSAFHQTDLDQVLRCHSVQHLIVCGVTTEVCVHTTVRAATDFGYFCTTINDACAATEAHLQQPALEMLGVEGGIFGEVSSTSEILARLVAST